MKRIHLFEVEDFNWVPNWLRRCMTLLIVVMHRILGSPEQVAKLVSKALLYSKKPEIIDLCSGSGGPMPEVIEILQNKYNVKNIKLTLSDLYPDTKMAETVNGGNNKNITYLTTPLDAAKIGAKQKGVRTMVGSLHHMKPDIAHNILKDAKESRQPICIFEISDNSFPAWLWWIAIPINTITSLFVTLAVRPMTWQQIVFTYIIPIIPLAFAWDGAVSNARTYTLSDMDELLEGLHSDDYTWEKGTIKGKSKKLYLLGLPVNK
ncbi:MAG: hypothetical protein ABUK01_07580 [Leptospirales bacterium]